MHKKALVWLNSWGEIFTAMFLAIGLLVSISAGSAMVNYIVIFLSGMMVGRLYHIRNHRLVIPYFLIVLAYLAGFLAGAAARGRGHWAALLLLFSIGCYLGEFIHRKEYCK